MESGKGFTHLHVHSEYSFLDALCPIEQLVKAAATQNSKALAITDHGNLHGIIKFYDACKKHGIKPIIGCEFYIVDDRNLRDSTENDHIVLLAKNNKGLKNLYKLSTLSSEEEFFHLQPRIDLKVLSKYSEGLICLSACIAGRIPKLLLDERLPNNYELAKEYALKLKSFFAEGDFYIELQDHGLLDERKVNPLLVKLAKEIGVKCVATNDVHYINREDFEYHDILLCIQTQLPITNPNRMKFPNDEFYLKTRSEMEDIFSWCKEAIESTDEIADKCNAEIEFKKFMLPKYPCPDDLDPPTYLRNISYEGLEHRYNNITDEIVNRLNYELDVIISMGFAEYYLIVWDFVYWAKSQNILVGPGRGSGVGSLVAYVLQITDIDPIKYNLLFERFLNPNRTSMPDFDIDFCPERRDEIVRYIASKYGEGHISKIITFGHMKKRQALKDSFKAYGLDTDTYTAFSKLIPDDFYANERLNLVETLDPSSSYYVSEIADKCKDPTYLKIIQAASKFDNLVRHTSVHAAGVMIYREPAFEILPLTRTKDNEIVTQFDKHEVERLGQLKMDLLSLITLSDLRLTRESIKRQQGIDVAFNFDFEDKKVYDLISRGDTDTIFQFESEGMKAFLRNLKPKSLEYIIAGVALYRPGPMDNIDMFVSQTQNPKLITYEDPRMEPILSTTAGIIIYQEQAMMITQVLAGYDMNRADQFRSIITGKQKDLMSKEEEIFIYGLRDKRGNHILNEEGKPVVPGCIKNGMSESTAIHIFDKLKKFGNYAFNKSHAAAYAVVAYMTAYYKAYYPVDYMAAVINNRMEKTTYMRKCLRLIKNMGIEIIKPDINTSGVFFIAEKESIRYGLGSIKGMGKMGAISAIIEEREKNGKFKSFYDFIERTVCLPQPPSISVYESLIKSGALSSFGLFMSTMMINLKSTIEKAKAYQKSLANKQYCLLDFFGTEIKPDTSLTYPETKEFPLSEILTNEIETLNMYMSGHPLESLQFEKYDINFYSYMLINTEREDNETDEDNAEDDEFVQNNDISGLKDNMKVFFIGIIREHNKRISKNGSVYHQLQVDDLYGSIQLILFDRTAKRCFDALEKGTIVGIHANISIKESRISLRCDNLTKIDSPEDLSPQQDSRKLYVNIEITKQHKLESIEAILSGNPGPNPVYYQLNKKIYRFNNKVNNLELASMHIANVLGAENTKIVEITPTK